MSQLRDNRGFTVIDTIITVVILIAIIIVGYFAFQAHNKVSHDQTVHTSVTPMPADSLDFKQWGVTLKLPESLIGLTYTYTADNASVNIVSPQLKGQPSICSGQTITDGSLAAIERTTNAPQSGFPGDEFPADLQRHIGAYYYVLSLPNGSTCQKTASLNRLALDQTTLLRQAFLTLHAN